MASQAPTVQSLQTWEDAFVHYSLPTVRALEKELRKNVDENRSKLRSLVGASYRDLLGTAERIIEMDKQMAVLELGLRDMGKKCNARTLERSGSNWAEMNKRSAGGDGAEMAAAAQTKVLQGCLTLLSRVVRGKRDALLGAKVLVLARLLAKSIGESAHAPAVLEELRKKLISLRKRLLGYIERSMTKAGVEKTVLAGTLCAYALVTSSAPREVLRHFLQVRFRQLENKADAAKEGEVLEMLDLYSQTLLDTKDFFPRRFADALSHVVKATLLRDLQLYAAHELSLDIYGQWIAEDVRSFTPWVQHDQVTISEVGGALASWTKQAHECLLTGLEEYLHSQDSLAGLVDSRHIVLLKFMALSSRSRSDNHYEATDNIRTIFLKRMKSIVVASARLSDLQLNSPSSPAGRKVSLWELAREDTDLCNGAHAFRDAIIRRRYDRNSEVHAEIVKLDAWSKRIESSLDSIELLRTRKWDDDLEFDIDDLEDGGKLQKTLSKQDPAELMASLSAAVEDSVAAAFKAIQSASTSADSPAHVLRLLRELDMRIRVLQNRVSFSAGHLSHNALQRQLSQLISQKAVEDLVRSVRSASHVATTLWDGSPPLPVQPAPPTFKFLTDLHRAMSEAGDDLWTTDCVRELCSVVHSRLRDGLLNALEAQNALPHLTNGHIENGRDIETADRDASQTLSREGLLQILFDQLYLQQIFHLSGDSQNGLAGVIAELKKRTELDGPAEQRTQKSANEYWKRTHLLFGLLAHSAKD